MFNAKQSYDLQDKPIAKSEYVQIDSAIPILYQSLSANTQNALDRIQTITTPVRSRSSSLISENIPIEKIEDALKEGFIETAKMAVNQEMIEALTNQPLESNLNFYKKADNYVQDDQISIKPKKNSFKRLKQMEIVINDHMITLEEFIRKHETNTTNGLTKAEANKKLAEFGPNELKQKRKTPVIVKFVKEFFSGFNIMLWIATILSVLCYQPLGGDNPDMHNLVITGVLVFAIVLQSVFSFIQQYRADNLMASFNKLMPSKTTVLRDGAWIKMNAADLVIGDVVRITGGEKVPADIRIIECSQASVEKSALTGESEPVKLSVDTTDLNPYETKNLALFGSSLLEGSATGIVFQTGHSTIMGKISEITVSTKSDMTTMQREINYFAIIIGSMSIGTGVLIFVVWLLAIKPKHPDFLNYAGTVAACLGAIVAFFPDGIPVSVTMTMSLIAKKMKKINLLVKKLSIIETLGSTTIVASDKTGTITMNKMTLNHMAMVNFPIVNCLDQNTASDINDYYKFLLSVSGLCNKALIEETENRNRPNFNGSPTECGILKGALEYIDVRDLRKKYPILFEIPFNSRYKYHLTIHKNYIGELIPEQCTVLKQLALNKTHICLIKGAPEVITDLCAFTLDYDKVKSFTSARKQCLDSATNLASKGERVLAFAFAFLNSNDNNFQFDETNLPESICFAGLLSLIDPPRLGVAEAVAKCHGGGIKVMMVTGDHPLTAISIAKLVNIVSDTTKSVKTFNDVKTILSKLPKDINKNDNTVCMNIMKLLNKIGAKLLPRKPQIITKKYDVQGAVLIIGKDIPEFEVEHWDYVLSHNEIVFARTTPQNKLAIVQQLQRRGELVTVTGDGVNDAPALKKADIGIAMGISGSEISKEAAKIVIMDDNFSTIVNGIEQGRLLFDNLKKVIAYLLPAGSFSEIIPVIAYVFFGLPLPLTTLQMIAICLCTDVFGSLAMIYGIMCLLFMCFSAYYLIFINHLEYPESDIMKRKPRNLAKDRLVSFWSILKIYFQTGVLMSIIAFFMYYYTISLYNIDVSQLLFAYGQWNANITFAGVDLSTRNIALGYGQTAFFVSLVMTQLINLLTVRTRFQSCFRQRFRPSILWFMLAEVIVVVLFCYIPPLQPFLQSTDAHWYMYVFPLCMGLSIFFVDEIKKLLIRTFPNSWVRHLVW